MWNTLEHVAKSQRLDVGEFVKFALANAEKYHLDDHKMVGTWYVDDLVRDFKHKFNNTHMASELVTLAKDLLAGNMPNDILKKFQILVNKMSPENLSCDGECPRYIQVQKMRQIRTEWAALERQLGRKVTEEEIESSHWITSSTEDEYPMKVTYKVVTYYGENQPKAVLYHNVADLIAGVKRIMFGGPQTGTESMTAVRRELRGQPKFRDLYGPMYDGPGVVRYEDFAAYKYFST